MLYLYSQMLYFLSQDSLISQRSPMLNLYQEEKCRRIECENQNER
jgi:hypothetical protein